jgi:hypothetical protein
VFGLDDQLAQVGDGAVFAVVALVAVLLGLRHATDPDHLTAVMTLLAGEKSTAARARRLGLTWGLGHATSLLAFGVPIVVAHGQLPDDLEVGAEAAVGLVIVVLALRLLHRCREGLLDHPAGSRPARTPRTAYAVGLLHGMGGSAGVGVLLLGSIPRPAEALAALALFAAFTAVSMALASSTFGYVVSRGPVLRGYAAVAPALAVASLGFGVWYALGALDAVPYPF